MMSGAEYSGIVVSVFWSRKGNYCPSKFWGKWSRTV